MLYVDGDFVSVREREVARAARRARARRLRCASRASASAWRVLRRFYERYGEQLGAARAAQLRRHRARAEERSGFLAKFLDRVLGCRARTSSSRGCSPRRPRSPRRRRAFSTARAEAAAPRPAAARRRPRWSEHDLPLLDVARTLIDGPPRAYGHVIVDEAQDLSPMQLLADLAARRRRLADDPRRRRAGDRPGRLPALAGARAVPPRRRGGDDRGAAPRLPRAGRDHGFRAAAPRPDRARTSSGRSPTARAAQPPKLVRWPRRDLLGTRRARGRRARRAARRDRAALARASARRTARRSTRCRCRC